MLVNLTCHCPLFQMVSVHTAGYVEAGEDLDLIDFLPKRERLQFSPTLNLSYYSPPGHWVAPKDRGESILHISLFNGFC